MKILVVYTSKYGSTKQYAEWVAGELGATLKVASETSDADISAHDIVVCGGYLHIGTVVGADFIRRHWDTLHAKKVVLFTVAGAPAESPERTRWFEESLPQHISPAVHHVPLRGRALDLDWKDRALLSFPRVLMHLKHWATRDPKDKAALDAFKPFDAVRKESIAPLVAHIRQLSASS